MKKIYFFITVFFIITPVIAQTTCAIAWGTYTGLDVDKVVLDNTGNVYKFTNVNVDLNISANYYSSFTTASAHQTDIVQSFHHRATYYGVLIYIQPFQLIIAEVLLMISKLMLIMMLLLQEEHCTHNIIQLLQWVS
jgi:hypothetical protein